MSVRPSRARCRSLLILAWLTLAGGCQEGPSEQLCVYASADTVDLVAADLGCVDCYEVDGEDIVYEVRGDAPLGVQYGLIHLLELWGFRFFHPFEVVAPAELHPLDGHPELGAAHEPEMARRGLHLHTLHPIEGLWAVWVADDDAAERGERIVDWTIRNRGNHLQWVALDDISTYPSVHEDWHALTTDLNAYAHERGLTTGVGIQLFGSANLQLAFDLIDDIGTEEEQRDQVVERLSLVTDAGFDLYNLSFGEFFGEEPEVFLAAVDMAWQELQLQQPGAEMATVIHVGDSEDQQVESLGETMQYYFLTQFADPAIVPWVHSVMYYNLFEDAGGAYHHEQFDEHRQFLLDRLAADEPVGYFPESAYWVAFDNPVPTYLPLYVRSRWLDMDRIRAQDVGALQTHVLFSTGWEWGYWQNDYATLRMNYQLEDDWLTHVEQMYRPWGDDGGWLAIADDLHAEARTVVDARHADMHDPAPDRLVAEGANPTFYQYGYLIRADELCFWERERVEAAIVIEGSDETPPGCAI